MADSFASPALPADAIRLAIVLHAHTPFVPAPLRRHGYADALYASLAQSVVPLLNLLHRLKEEAIDAPITLALSPVWCEMMSDLSLPLEFEKYLHHHIESCRAQGREFASHGWEDRRDLALFWENWFQNIERDYEETWHRDIIGALREMQNEGRIEVLAVPATEAFLATLPNECAVEAQIQVGIDSYKKYFGTAPRGLWLPSAVGAALADAETQFAQSRLMRSLARRGLDAVVAGGPSHRGDDATRCLTAHSPSLRAVLGGEVGASPPEDSLSIIEGVAVLRPHCTLTEQVWNRDLGYCGDEHFLDSQRRYGPSALRLWRITDAGASLCQRQIYEPFGTASICQAQADHWLERVRETAAASPTAGAPLCVAFDLDLFGAHWFEGHNWLYRILKQAAHSTIELTTTEGASALDAVDSRHMMAVHSTAPRINDAATQSSAPSLWFNSQTAWLWPEIDDAHHQLSLMAQQHRDTANTKLAEILDQCGRECLLMQSIDWPLALSTTCDSLVASRFADHVDALRRLLQIAQTVAHGEFMSEGERAFLAAIADRDDLFPELSFRLWAE